MAVAFSSSMETSPFVEFGHNFNGFLSGLSIPEWSSVPLKKSAFLLDRKELVK